MEFAIVSLLASHLVCVNLASAGPLVTIWLGREAARGNQAVVLHLRDGRQVYLGSDHPNRLESRIRGAMGTAGGHGSMAGGQVRLDGRDPEILARQISQAVLAYFNISPEETSRSLLIEGEG